MSATVFALLVSFRKSLFYLRMFHEQLTNWLTGLPNERQLNN